MVQETIFNALYAVYSLQQIYDIRDPLYSVHSTMYSVMNTGRIEILFILFFYIYTILYNFIHRKKNFHAEKKNYVYTGKKYPNLPYTTGMILNKGQIEGVHRIQAPDAGVMWSTSLGWYPRLHYPWDYIISYVQRRTGEKESEREKQPHMCIMYSVQCTLCSIQFTVYSVDCIMHTLQYTMHNVHHIYIIYI